MATRIQHRRDTAAAWAAANPVLAAGEPGLETDAVAGGGPLKQKLGDGTTAWSALPYTGTTDGSVPVGTTTANQSYVPATVLRGTGIDASGAADSGPSLQSKINADTTSELFLPTGLYLTSVTLSIPAGKRLVLARGATIRGTGGVQPIALGADAVLTGGAIDGGTALYCTAINGDRARIDNVQILNGTYGVGHGSSTADVVIERCLFLNNGSYGVLVENLASRTIVRGNTFLSTTNPNQQGVTVKTNTGGTPVDSQIIGNTVDVPGTMGLEIQASGTRGLISNNIVRRCTIGISLSGAVDVTVSGNTVVGCSVYGIEAAQVTIDSTISGNTVVGCGTGICATSPTSSPACSNIIIVGNTIKNCTIYGIQIEFGSNHNISNNTIIDPVGIAIFLNNGPFICLISDNIIRRTNTNANCIQSNSGNANTFSGNAITFTATGTGYGFFLNGDTDSALLGNHVFGGTKAYAFQGCDLVRMIGNVSRLTTQHGIYTLSTAKIYVEAHYHSAGAGLSIDFSGATSPTLGTYFELDQAKWGGLRHTSSYLGLYNVNAVPRAAAVATPTAPSAAYVQAEATAMKTAVDAIRVALANIGITL